MSKVICKNCNGEFSDELSVCPYCGTMHKRGAYKNFRKKISDIIDSLLGLKIDIERSTSRIILSSVLRAVLICIFVIGLALLLSFLSNTNYYNDKEFDEKRLNDIIWQNENISKLDEAYKNNDMDTINKLYYENSSVVSNWQHYSSYCLTERYQYILKNFDYFNEYDLEYSLYFIYYPDYYARSSKLSNEEYEKYMTQKVEITEKLVEMGYLESELQMIYDRCKDDYGYIQMDMLRKYFKGENNG